MNRRTFLTNTTGVIVVLSGCLGTSTSTSEETEQSNATPKSNPTPPERKSARAMPYIIRRDFTLADPEKRFTAGNYNPDKRFKNAATVEFDTDTNRVLVLGRIRSGSRSCMKTTLQTAAYDSNTVSLDIVIFDDLIRPDRDGGCTTEMAVVPYKTVVKFKGGLPRTVDITYLNDNRKTQFTKTARNN